MTSIWEGKNMNSFFEELKNSPEGKLEVLTEQSFLNLTTEQIEAVDKALLHQISHSSGNVFQLCEKRFQLDRLSVGREDEDGHTAFGHAVGAGIQALFLFDGNLEKAASWVFFHYNKLEWEELDEKILKKKKTLAHAWAAVKKFVPFWQLLSQDWEIAVINGKPAVEFSMRITLPNGFMFRSYVDILLKKKTESMFAVLELKTTGFTRQHEAQWKNSDQGTAYAVPIDSLGPQESYFWVKYFCFYTTQEEWVPFDFDKKLVDKVNWIRTLLRDTKDIERCIEDDFWPKRGSACMSFGRVCPYFGSCDLPVEHILPHPGKRAEKLLREMKTVYQYEVSLDEILERYLQNG